QLRIRHYGFDRFAQRYCLPGAPQDGSGRPHLIAMGIGQESSSRATAGPEILSRHSIGRPGAGAVPEAVSLVGKVGRGEAEALRVAYASGPESAIFGGFLQCDGSHRGATCPRRSTAGLETGMGGRDLASLAISVPRG